MKERIDGLDGVLFRKLPKKGCELTAQEGYKFYDLQNSNNYDEDGNLRPLEEICCEYMTCLCETKEQVKEHIRSVKIENIENTEKVY